jgi:hypothetical protein
VDLEGVVTLISSVLLFILTEKVNVRDMKRDGGSRCMKTMRSKLEDHRDRTGRKLFIINRESES